MKAVCETLIGSKTYTVDFKGQNSMGIRSWLAVQCIALAIMLAGPLDVERGRGTFNL